MPDGIEDFESSFGFKSKNNEVMINIVRNDCRNTSERLEAAEIAK